MRQPKGRYSTRPGPLSPEGEKTRSYGIRPEFYDPAGERYGLPTYPWRMAPAGMATKRQLAAQGLRPGGQEVAAQVAWWHGGGRDANGRAGRSQRVAYLYPVSGAKPKRQPSPAQLAACGLALLARMTCPACGQVKDYCISKRLGECNDCAAAARSRR